MTSSGDNPRGIKAISIAAGAGQWLTCRAADGSKRYGIPSQRQAGQYYLVTSQSCDCQDARRHPGQSCKHQLSVRLFCELVKAQQAKPKFRHRLGVHATPADYAEIFKAGRAQRR